MLVSSIFKEAPCDLGVDTIWWGNSICLWLDDEETKKVIRNRDPRLFDALDFVIDNFDEIMIISAAEGGGFDPWWLDERCAFYDYLDIEEIEEWIGQLEIILNGKLANDDLRKKAAKSLIWAKEKAGFGVEMLEPECPPVCSSLKTLLSLYECDAPKFYGCRKHLPDRTPGIYLLYNGGDIEYVGHSKNIKHRLGGNHSYFDDTSHVIGVINIEDKTKRKTVEVAAIGVLHPPKNRSWNYERSNE